MRSKVGMLAKRWGVGLCLLALAGAAGCGWFDTRDPLPGEPEEPVPWTSPIDPEIVLANMDSALVYLGRGIDNYARCLGDTFHFYPTPDDAVVLAQEGKPTAFDNWNKEVEREVMDLVVNSSKSVELTFIAADRNVVADTEEYKVWEEHYRLSVSSLSGQSATYEGVARLELRIDPAQANQWFITSWQDYEWPGQSADTWGLFRGRTRPI